ncbi:NADH-quinone oxidoreductase subunit NuoE [Clostridium sp. CX1]|uniref:NADH-quinone oxidoreductase subunit NuoE n=1 Tax=Clostridium tanneri TaxID=3037988 RepID=A0ABU4JXG4_9CLOT|nr:MULTISPECIES: NADH-quinone oxidoreductase subunit NuoE [unclassified Clostridium]MCT8978646.1 NADH-quinone oxidoreductase subunit NuoE [Clostridium sp. CX1]MDW8802843.1 NADH-quinone oxidoreductase subunit NuoE [Clostridium sp. A1-XYC3]
MACGCEKELESKFNADKVDLSQMDKVFERYFNENGNLISILQDVQGVYGYLPLDALRLISDKTGKKKAQIYGVATFYSQFRLNKLGKYVIMQCQGTACHVNGSEAVSQAICDELSINPGETSSDGMFSLEEVACLGCCSLAPVIMINGETYANLTPDKARKVIQDIYAKEKGEAV